MDISQLNLISRKDIKRHFFVWLLVTVFVCLVDPIKDKLSIQIIGTFLIMLAYMFVFYAQYLFNFRFIYFNKKIKFLISAIFIFIVFLLIFFLNYYFVFSMFRFKGKIDYNFIYDWILSCFILFSIVSIIAYGIFQNKISLFKLQKEYEKEKNLLFKELGFFKNQFNSHITFNFLNYCYNYVNMTSKETAHVIELYSEMLRYTINCKPDEEVLLSAEIEYIEKFIRLKEQLNEGIQVRLFTNGDLRNKYILPRILITFIENAIKHGETHCKESPINIKINVDESLINFIVSNKINLTQRKVVSTGIGQENVKSQLELFYNEKFELTIDKDEIYYNVLLKINLN